MKSYGLQHRREVFLEQLGDPVVLLEEDDVQGGEEGVLVDAHLAGHEVVHLLRPQQGCVRTLVQLMMDHDKRKKMSHWEKSLISNSRTS